MRRIQLDFFFIIMQQNREMGIIIQQNRASKRNPPFPMFKLQERW